MNAQRKEYFAVVRPPMRGESDCLPSMAMDAEHAQALAVVKTKEYPNLGPFRVVRLVEAE